MKVPIAFVLLLTCAMCGVAGMSALIVLPVGTAGLLSRSWPLYAVLWERARKIQQERAVYQTLALSALNAAAATAAAYLLGVALRLVVLP